MLQVAIVGDRDSGKTTFLGLLYAAQVKSGSARADDFRFHADFESLDDIAAVFQGLMSGGFPDTATKEGIQEIKFSLGFGRHRHGIVPFRRSRRWAPGDSAAVRFTLLRTHSDEVSRYLKGSSVVNGRVRDLLDADAVVILADGTNLATKAEEPELGPMREYDRVVESLLTAIAHWRESGGRQVLYPIIVVSKFDHVRPEVFRSANVEASPPHVGKRAARATYAEALLGPNLTRTLAKVKGPARGKLRFGPVAYFFSWVRTEAGTTGQGERIRLRRGESVGWELEYSRDEYLGFLECLRDVAARVND